MRGLIRVVWVAGVAVVALGSLAVAEGPRSGWPVNQPAVAWQVETPTRATTLSQPPNQSTGGYSDGDCDGCAFGAQAIADNFRVTTGGLGFGLQQIRLWGAYYPGNTPVVDAYDVFVHVNSSQLPGAVVCSQTGIAPTSRTATGVPLFGVDEYEVVLNLAATCDLVAGTYWVEVFDNTGSGTDDWFWEAGATDVTNGFFGNAFANETPGVTWGGNAWDVAIELGGVNLQDVIFADGFESGDTALWSNVVP